MTAARQRLWQAALLLSICLVQEAWASRFLSGERTPSAPYSAASKALRRATANCTQYVLCGQCAAAAGCSWCDGERCVDAGGCPTPVACDEDTPWSFVLGAVVLSFCGVGVAALWYWLWRRHARLVSTSGREYQSKVPPPVAETDEHGSSSNYSELLLDDPEELGGSSDHRALFIGSVVNTDRWYRVFYRSMLLPAVMLGFTVLLLLASLLAVPIGGQSVYWWWPLLVLALWLLVPAWPIGSLFAAAYARRIHAYMFYNGKLVLWRANGVMTEFVLDSSTTHESDADRFWLFTCAAGYTRITTYSSRWSDPLVLYVSDDDKAIFLRFLYYATSEEQAPSSYYSFRDNDHSAEEQPPPPLPVQREKDWLDDDDDDEGSLVMPEAQKERDWLDDD